MVSIVEVTTKAQLRRFVEYPMELYKDVPQYIPGTYDDDLEDWDRKKNPAFEYCQASMATSSMESSGSLGVKFCSHIPGADRIRVTALSWRPTKRLNS